MPGKFYGAIRSQPDPRDHAFAPARTRDVLPASTNNRAHYPFGYDQGRANTCVANAVPNMVRYARRRFGLPDFAPSRLYYYYGARMREGRTPLRDTGSSIRATVEMMVKAGFCAEEVWPYNLSKINDAPTTPANFSAAAHRPTAGHYSSLSVSRDKSGLYYDLDAMRACLAAGWPFTVGFPITDRLHTSNGFLEPPTGPLTGGEEAHCVVAVDYDDKAGAVLCANSWRDLPQFWLRYEQIQNPLFGFDYFAVDSWGVETV